MGIVKNFKMKKHFLIILVALLWCNILQAQESTTVKIDESQMYVKMTDNLPIKGKENEVFMGDRMVEQRTGYFLECIVPNFDVNYENTIRQIIIIKKDVPMCKETINSKVYIPPYENVLQGTSKFKTSKYEVKLKGKKEGKLKLCLVTLLLDAYCEKKLSSDDFYYSKTFVSEKDSFQRVIEYAGKKGSIVKFIYSEFKDGIARTAFMREFEIDLNDGNTVAYKGCVFEIIKVDNATITYKVIRHFE